MRNYGNEAAGSPPLSHGRGAGLPAEALAKAGGEGGRRTASITSLLLCFSLAVPALSQEPDEESRRISEKYKGENIIQLSKTKEVTIDLVDGKVGITATMYNEHIYLDDNASLYAKKSIEYSGFYELLDIKAATLLPEKGRYKTIKVEDFTTKDELSSTVFHDDVKSKNFIYPSLKNGAKTTLLYTERITDPHFLDGFYFASYAPIEHARLTITCHQDVALDFKYFNITEKDLAFTATQKKDMITYTWTLNDAGKIRSETSAPDMSYIAPHIVVLIRQYTHNGNTRKVLSDAKDLHGWYAGLISGINRGKSPELKMLTDSITAGIDNETEKVKRIYYWVQDNIKYIAFEEGLGGFVPRDAGLVCTRRYGDCKDMASIITEMLDAAGIRAYLTWIGTRSIPYSYNEVPGPMADNHMIATYIRDGNYHYLDATNQHTPFGIPSSFIQGKEAMIHMDSANFEIRRVPVVHCEQNRYTDSVSMRIGGQGEITGSARSGHSGYFSTKLKYLIEGKSDKEREKILHGYYQKGNNKFEMRNILLRNERDKDRELVCEYDFLLRDYAKRNNDEMYVNMNLNRIFAPAEMEKERRYPSENDFRASYRYTTRIEIPDNYAVKYVPENTSYNDEEFGFNLSYETTDKEIVLNFDLCVNHLLLEKEKFGNWNEMIRTLNNAYSKVVVLKAKH